MPNYMDPGSYWGLSPEQVKALPLGLRYSNNLLNIKYFPGAERNQAKWPGLLGPSIARDQGDPQMQFANVEDSGVAGAGLLRRKYDSGMRTPMQLIAGKSGWTPGFEGGANSVARYAGVTPTSDLKLDTPEGMRNFLPALATQEHGEQARNKLFNSDMFDRIAERATGAQFATGELPKLDLLKEDGSNARRVWSDTPQRGDMGMERQPSSGAPAVAGYEQRAPQSQGQTAMPYDQPPRDPSLLEGIAGRMGNPLFQSGLGLFLSAAQGGDLNAGATSGMSRAKAMQDYYTQEQEQRQREIVKNGVRQWTNDDTIFGNVPPGLRAMTRLTGDPTAALNFISKHPEMELERRKLQLALEKQQADIASGNKPQVVGTNLVQNTPDGVKVLFSGEDQSAQRLASIKAAGMDPNDPNSKIFIATGKMPRDDQQLTATDKKAILEADEAVSRGEGVTQRLREAIALSPKAYEGPTASIRGYVTSLFGNEAGKATENLNNVVTSGTLENLKAIFGGNPTEGERKILLDLQGSANKADSVRIEIYKRALEAAERRQEFNRRKAEDIRGRNYFKPANAQTGAAPASYPAPTSAAIEELRKDKSKASRDEFDGIFGPGASDRVLRSR